MENEVNIFGELFSRPHELTWPEIARKCGYNELRLINSKIESLKLEYISVEGWDDFAKSEVAKELHFFTSIRNLISLHQENISNPLPSIKNESHVEEKCNCRMPPFFYLDYVTVKLGENEKGEATLEICKKCGTIWLKYLIEEPHYSGSGRWWKVETSKIEAPLLNIENAINYIESREFCYVGGSFHERGVHLEVKPIHVE